MGSAVHVHKPRKALGKLDPNTIASSRAEAAKPLAKPKAATVEAHVARTAPIHVVPVPSSTTKAASTDKVELTSPGADVEVPTPRRGAVVQHAQERMYFKYGREYVKRLPAISPRKSLDGSEPLLCSAVRAEGQRRRESDGSLPGSGNLKEKIKSPQATPARSPTPTKLLLLLPARAELTPDLGSTASHRSVVARSIQAAARRRQQHPLDSKLSEAQRQNMLLAQRLRESEATIVRLQEVTSSLQASRPSNGGSPEQRVASVMVVNELQSVEQHVVETHDVHPTVFETPPVSVQLRWLLEQEMLFSPGPSEPAELLSPSQPKQLQLFSPAPHPNSSRSQQRRTKSMRPGFRSPNSMLQSMVHGLRTPARQLWRRRLVVVSSSTLR